MSISAIECDIFAYRPPVADPEFVGPVIDQGAIDPAMAEEFEVGHISRMQPGDLRKIVAPFQRRHSAVDPLLIDRSERVAFNAAAVADDSPVSDLTPPAGTKLTPTLDRLCAATLTNEIKRKSRTKDLVIKPHFGSRASRKLRVLAFRPPRGFAAVAFSVKVRTGNTLFVLCFRSSGCGWFNY